MAIIKRKRGNVIYLYEVTYVGIKDGKQQYKEKCLGHLDENGDLIPSKKNRKKAMSDAPAELAIKTTTKKIIIRPKKEKEPVKAETTSTQAKEITSGTTKLETKVFSPKDNPAFYGDSSEIQMWVGNNKKKELLTIVSIDFNEMKKKGVLIPCEKKFFVLP